MNRSQHSLGIGIDTALYELKLLPSHIEVGSDTTYLRSAAEAAATFLISLRFFYVKTWSGEEEGEGGRE